MNNINTSAIISTSPRRYDIDALRIFAFTLLILYHVSMLYALGEDWHVKSAYQTDALHIPRLLVNQWRMSLLFVISGLAVSFVWQRYSAGRFALRRTRQLLVPLIFGMAFVVAPQCYYQALSNGVIEPGFLRFMGQYLTFQDFPGEAWAGEITSGTCLTCCSIRWRSSLWPSCWTDRWRRLSVGFSPCGVSGLLWYRSYR